MASLLLGVSVTAGLTSSLGSPETLNHPNPYDRWGHAHHCPEKYHDCVPTRNVRLVDKVWCVGFLGILKIRGRCKVYDSGFSVYMLWLSCRIKRHSRKVS